MFYEFLFISSLKILFLPAYFSTDFFVHRNWLAITSSRNTSQWYYDNTSEWTLDYPPFFAYFEYILTFPAKLFDEQMLKVENIDYASFNTVLFQRLSVIFTDIIYFLGVWQCTKNVKGNRRIYHYVLLLGNIGLIYVDHIHFQYNGILFGILLLSCGKMIQKKYLQSAFYYALLLNMKHIFIYIAPVYVLYLLRHYCFSSKKAFIINSLKLGSIVLTVTAISFGPFIDHFPQLLTRLFPFKRGLTHAYWAPNFWAIYNMLDKVLSIILNVKHSNSSTGGLVQEQIHSVLPQITPKMTFLITAISMIPCCIKILINREASVVNFLKPLIICAACSFMFGWHVHEKAILMILIPMQILTSNCDSEENSSFFLAVFGLYSLTPLLYSKELAILKLSLFVIYIMINYCIFKQNNSYKPPVIEKIYNFGIFMLPFYEFILQYLLKIDKILPFMPLMLTSVYCGLGMIYFWLKYYIKYMLNRKIENPKKIK
ncbi:probable dolichyl pyrophosphate Glc1Man9GlcNAc2 alpha-1,3-glucosyltransferase [Chironomus tepperi]|uniref:probable dolichyl pyrophosphate Glc1Man9GlcNAc2 alpha-1,3-glucosyltransferase n=1 Tax=Chironomus tepperi TaxID=113505 RepID=UPI00391F36C2